MLSTVAAGCPILFHDRESDVSACDDEATPEIAVMKGVVLGRPIEEGADGQLRRAIPNGHAISVVMCALVLHTVRLRVMVVDRSRPLLGKLPRYNTRRKRRGSLDLQAPPTLQVGDPHRRDGLNGGHSPLWTDTRLHRSTGSRVGDDQIAENLEEARNEVFGYIDDRTAFLAGIRFMA